MTRLQSETLPFCLPRHIPVSDFSLYFPSRRLVQVRTLFWLYCTSGLTLWTRGKAEPRGLCPVGVTQPGSRLASSPRAHRGSWSLHPPLGRKQRARTASKILTSPTREGLPTCKKERLNGNDRSQVHSLLLCLASPLSLLSQPFYGCFQFLRPWRREKKKAVTSRAAENTKLLRGRRKGGREGRGEEGGAVRASHEWRCGSCHPMPPRRGPPQPSPSYAFPVSPPALGHELPIINFYWKRFFLCLQTLCSAFAMTIKSPVQFWI